MHKPEKEILRPFLLPAAHREDDIAEMLRRHALVLEVDEPPVVRATDTRDFTVDKQVVSSDILNDFLPKLLRASSCHLKAPLSAGGSVKTLKDYCSERQTCLL